jgi:hypothetical protein
MASKPLSTRFDFVDCQVQIPENVRLQMLLLKISGEKILVVLYATLMYGLLRRLDQVRRRFWRDLEGVDTGVGSYLRANVVYDLHEVGLHGCLKAAFLPSFGVS